MQRYWRTQVKQGQSKLCFILHLGDNSGNILFISGSEHKPIELLGTKKYRAGSSKNKPYSHIFSMIPIDGNRTDLELNWRQRYMTGIKICAANKNEVILAGLFSSATGNSFMGASSMCINKVE